MIIKNLTKCKILHTFALKKKIENLPTLICSVFFVLGLEHWVVLSISDLSYILIKFLENVWSLKRIPYISPKITFQKVHFQKNTFPKVHYPECTIPCTYTCQKLHFPERALARDYISLNVHLPEITFS